MRGVPDSDAPYMPTEEQIEQAKHELRLQVQRESDDDMKVRPTSLTEDGRDYPEFENLSDEQTLKVMRGEEHMRRGLETLCQQFIRPGMVCAEVGVFAGESSRIFVDALKGWGELYCVDHWQRPWAKRAEKVFKQWAATTPNVRTINKESGEAANEIEDYSLDFVYIDASHAYPNVKRDIELWKPKIKPGGVLAGHDYNPEHHPGVVQAVEEKFAGSIHHFEDGSWAVYAWPSQHGEDSWINDHWDELKLRVNGFFVEFGAGDGCTLSNTLFLEKKYGWHGLLCEPDPRNKIKGRPLSIVERCAIGPPGEIMLGCPLDPYLSGKLRTKSAGPRVVRAHKFARVKSVPLSELLDKHKVEHVDVISIDVEGTELEAWATLDLTRWRPRVAIVELLTWGLPDTSQQIIDALATDGYKLACRTFHNGIFVDER